MGVAAEANGTCTESSGVCTNREFLVRRFLISVSHLGSSLSTVRSDTAGIFVNCVTVGVAVWLVAARFGFG